MDRLRTPLFLLALVLSIVVVAVEVGATNVLEAVRGGSERLTSMGSMISGCPDYIPDCDDDELNNDFDDEVQAEADRLLNPDKPPGFAIKYLALIDGILVFTMALMAASLVFPRNLIGKFQGCATLILSILLILGAIVLALLALVAVLTMVSMLLSFPFGTIAYLAIFGSFDRGGASAILGLLMTLKIGLGLSLIFAHQRFPQNLGLVLLVLTSLLGTFIVTFLHGIVPGFLVSITDGIAAIILAIIAIVWAIILLIGSIPAIIKALKPAI